MEAELLGVLACFIMMGNCLLALILLYLIRLSKKDGDK